MLASSLQQDCKETSGSLGHTFADGKQVGRTAWGVMTDYEETCICKEMPLLCIMEPGTILVLVLFKYKNSFCLVQEQRWPPQNICRGTKHRQDSLSTICCSSASTNAWHEEKIFSSFSKKPIAWKAAGWILLFFHFRPILYWGIHKIILKQDFSFPACKTFYFPAAGKHHEVIL